MDSKKSFEVSQMADQYLDDDDYMWPTANSMNYELSEYYDDFGGTQHAEYGNYEEDRREKHLREREKDGEFCIKCNEFYPFAEPNQSNMTMICYSCKLFEKMSK